MIVREVTHHGDLRREREVVLPDPPTRADVAGMFASCVYPYTHVSEDRLEAARDALIAGKVADHGWTSWEVIG